MKLPNYDTNLPVFLLDALVRCDNGELKLHECHRLNTEIEISAVLSQPEVKASVQRVVELGEPNEILIPLDNELWLKIVLFLIEENTVKMVVFSGGNEKRKEVLAWSIIELFDDVIFELDHNLIFLRVYTNQDKHLFIPQDQIIGRSLKDVFQGELYQRFEKVFEQAKRSGIRQVIEYPSPMPDDKRWFRADVFEVNQPNVSSYYLAAVSDITERKKTNDALKFHSVFEELLVQATSILIQSDENSFDDSLEGVLKKIGEFSKVDRSYFFRFNDDGTTMSNTHEWAALNISPEKENLQDVPINFAPEWMATLHRSEEVYISSVADLPDSWSFEKAILEPQGVQSLLAVPVKASNILYGFLGFDAVTSKIEWDNNARHLLRILADNLGSVIHRNVQNISLREANEDALRLAVEASAASKAKSDFLANMSHEIRTPLNGVVGFTDLMKTTKLTLLQEQYVKNIEDSAQTLMDLINQVLDFSKIESGKLLLDLEQHSLLELVESACMLVRHASGTKGLEFELKLIGHIPDVVTVDAIRLKQVLVNLLSNAIKFTHSGKVILKISSAQHPEHPTQSIFDFEISDTGIGISEEQKRNLFKAFVQADIATTKKYGGTGLGLVISNNILEMMGSKLELSSQLEVGSTFSFRLTLDYRHSKLPKVDYKYSYAAIISDQEDFLEHVPSILERLQLDYRLFKNSTDFMAFVKENQLPSAVIGLETPGTSSGVTLVKYLKSQFKGSAHLPFATVIYYVKEDMGFHEVARMLQVDACMQLPVLPLELNRKLMSTVQENSLKKFEQKDAIIGEFETRLENISLLIVEDNEVNLLLTKIVMTQCFPNAVISEARNGEEAVDLVSSNNYDIVLMDMQMPRMDGYQAIKILRERKIDVPIISLTANAIIGERERCLEIGATEYLTKPMSKEALKTIVEKLILT